MSWIRRNLPWLLVALVLVTTAGFVGALAVGALVFLQGLLTGAAVGALFGDLALAVGAATLLGAIDLALVVALVVTVLRRASLPRGERFAALAGTAERYCPPLRRFELADRFAPTLDDRIDRLEERYLDGDISEVEFERRMDELLEERSDGEGDRGGGVGVGVGGDPVAERLRRESRSASPDDRDSRDRADRDQRERDEDLAR